jgi:hypothetical protein
MRRFAHPRRCSKLALRSDGFGRYHLKFAREPLMSQGDALK